MSSVRRFAIKVTVLGALAPLCARADEMTAAAATANAPTSTDLVLASMSTELTTEMAVDGEDDDDLLITSADAEAAPKSVDGMGLDWGVAEIGPGVLFANATSAGSGGAPSMPRSGASGSGPMASLLPSTDILTPLDDTPQTTAHAPEPATILVWSLLAAGWLLHRQRRSRVAD